MRCTQSLWCTSAALHMVIAVYTNAVVHMRAVVHASSVEYTGAAVQIAAYMLFLLRLGHP
eukprot:508711-Pyramimonas_sp.AAC.1